MGSLAQGIFQGVARSIAANAGSTLPASGKAGVSQQAQTPGVQAQQTPLVNTGATLQTPQAVQDPRENERRRQMIELLAKQGLDQRQIQERLADLDDQKFFQSPAERVEETRKVPPRGLLSAGTGEIEQEEKPRGILGI